MKKDGFSYIVKALVLFTEVDLPTLDELAKAVDKKLDDNEQA